MPDLDSKLHPTIPDKNYVHMDRKAQKIWIKDPKGNILSENFAVSGNPGYTDPKFERIKNVGPIPEGEYTFRPKGRIVHEKGMWQAIKDYNLLNWLGPSWLHRGRPGGEVAWGPYHWDITPKKGTKTWKRDGFTIHGGWGPGSAGCIDLANPGKLISTKDILFNYWKNSDWKEKLKIPFQLLNGEEAKMNPGANKNLEEFRKNVEKYLGDQDEVLLRISKRFKSNPNMMQQMNNMKVAAFTDEELDTVIKNRANLSKLESPLQQLQDRLRSSTEEFTQLSTRNWLKNLGFLDKFKLFLSRLFGIESDVFKKFKSDQAAATRNYIKQSLSGFRSAYEKQYGKGSFKQGLLTGDPRFINYASKWSPISVASKTNEKNTPQSFSQWIGSKMYDYAKPQISSEFNKSWTAQSTLPQKDHRQYWTDRVRNIYTSPSGGLFDSIKRKIVNSKLKDIPKENWENLSRLEQFSDMFEK